MYERGVLMKSFLKILIGLSVLSYFNVLFLNYQIRTDGLDSIHPFWIFTITVPVLLALIGFSESFKEYKRYTFIDILLKVTIIVIVIRAVNLEEQWYLVFNLLTIPLFIANILIEWFFYTDYVKYMDDKKVVELSYYQMIEEAQKNPDISTDIQEKFLHAIHYSRTLFQLLISGIFFIFSITSVLAILKYHDVIAGILLGIIAIASIFIFTIFLLRALKMHIRLKMYIPKKRMIINIIFVFVMLLVIAVTTVLISFYSLSIEFYLLVPLSYVFAMPIVISNNRFAQIWLDRLNDTIASQKK